MNLGNAQPGDKTLLDALIPATEAVRVAAMNKTDIRGALKEAENAAKEGMESTIEMISKVGRARSLGERTRGTQDAGATVVYLFLTEITEALLEFH